MTSSDQARLTNILVRRTRNIQDAEDACQEAYLKCWRKFGSQSNELPERYFVRVGLNVFRSSLRRKRSFDLVDMNSMSISAKGEDRTELIESKAILADSVDSLPMKYRLPIRQFYFQGWSISRIAQDSAESKNTIKSRLRRGRSLLRECLLKREIN